MEQTLGTLLLRVASDYGLSLAVLVGVVIYFIRKEKRFEEKDKETTLKLTSTIDRLVATIDGLGEVVRNSSKTAEEVKEQNEATVKSIEGLSTNFTMLNKNLELMKKIDTQEQQFSLKNIDIKLDGISHQISELKK